MSNLVLQEPLAMEVRQMADAEGVTTEEVVKAAMRSYRAAVRRRKIKAEAAWWASVPAGIRARYAGEYVAVHREKVVDHDPDQLTLYRRIRARYGDTPVMLAPVDGLREIRVISTRLERP